MYGTNDLLTQQNAQAQISASDLQLDAYKQRGAEEYGEDKIAQNNQRKEAAHARRRAERLRLRTARIADVYGEPEEETQVASERLVRANAGDRPVSAPQGMSERQKKKSDRRKEKNLRQGKKKYGNEATENTLPMSRRVLEFRKKHAKETENKSEKLDGILLESNTEGLDEAFSRFVAFPDGSDAFISKLKEHMEKNHRMKKSLTWYDALPEETRKTYSSFERARVEEVRSAQINLEKMLRYSLMANGVDFDTGGPTSPAVTQWAKCELVKAHAAYQESFKRAGDAMAEAMVGDKVKDSQFLQKIEADKEEEEDSRDIAFDDIPVVYVPGSVDKYEAYQKLRRAIDMHPEQYGEHKDTIDGMATELLDVWNKISRENMRLMAAEEIKKQDVGSSYAHRFDALMEKARKEYVAPLEERFALLRKGMHVLLEGGDVDGPDAGWMHAQLESEFGIVTERRRAELGAQAEAGAKFARIEELNGNAEIADVYTDEALRISEEIHADKRRLGNAMNDFLPHDEQGKYLGSYTGDQRTMKLFFRGYEVGENGEPKTAEDAANKAADEAFAHAFISSDKALIAPHLDRIVDEFLRAEFNADSMKREYMHENALRMKKFADRAVYMENMMKDEAWYFDGLPKERLERLNAIVDLSVKYGGVLYDSMAEEGLVLNDGNLFNSREAIAVTQMAAQMHRDAFEGSMKARRRVRVRILGGSEALSDRYDDKSLRIAEDISEEIAADNRRRENTKELEPSGSWWKDGRALPGSARLFVRGYEKNKDGEPLTEEDAQNKEADRMFLSDCFSKDPVAMRRSLDRITDEMLAEEEPHKDMLDESYVLENAVRLKNLGIKAIALNYIMAKNPWYFREIFPEDKLERLQRILKVYSVLWEFVPSVLYFHNVDAPGRLLPEPVDKSSQEAKAKRGLHRRRLEFELDRYSNPVGAFWQKA